MVLRLPEYYGAFRCLAGACPHTCCAGWEVVLDGETVRRYQALPGPLGEELRRTMALVEGEWCLPLRGEVCPFLDGEGLCRIHRALGEEATSLTCREHPRFLEEYGEWGEGALAASCPEGARLLLEGEGPLTFYEAESALEGEPLDPWDGAALAALRAGREEMLARLAGEGDLRRQVTGAAALALSLQPHLAGGDWEAMEAAARREAGELPPWDGGALSACLEELEGLEALDPAWPARLRTVRLALPQVDWGGYAAALGPRRVEYRRIMAYFLSRYPLRAVWDLELWPKGALCLALTAAAAALGGADWAARGETTPLRRQELLSALSREVEHSEENLEALENWAAGEGPEAILALFPPI